MAAFPNRPVVDEAGFPNNPVDAEVAGAWLDTSAEEVTSSLPVSGVVSGEEGWAVTVVVLGSWVCVSDSAASVAVDGANLKPVSPAPVKKKQENNLK